VQFDSLFNRLSQRQSFRTYLAGLLLPRDRPKTLTAIAGAEPWVQAQTPKVQQLQFFLSESVCMFFPIRPPTGLKKARRIRHFVPSPNWRSR
jgi:hypothetical protein